MTEQLAQRTQTFVELFTLSFYFQLLLGVGVFQTLRASFFRGQSVLGLSQQRGLVVFLTQKLLLALFVLGRFLDARVFNHIQQFVKAGCLVFLRYGYTCA